MVFSVGVQIEGKETGILVGDNNLIAEKLILVPAHYNLEPTVLVQAGDDIDVVVEIDAAIFHHDTNSRHVRAMVQLPSAAELLVEDLGGYIHHTDANPRIEIGFLFYLIPIFTGEFGHLEIQIKIKYLSVSMFHLHVP